MIKRRDALKTVALLAATTALGLSRANAQNWPTPYPKLIVGGAAGSVPDSLARLAADALSKTIGVTFVVENKPGAGGRIAMETVARSAPDGGTIGLATLSQLVFNSYLFSKLPYDPVRDLKPVAPLAWTSSVLAANPSLSASTLVDLIALANNEPGKLLFGIPQNGSPPHIAALLLMRETGLSATFVPFKSGPDALTAAMRGDVQLLIDGPTLIAPQVENGAIKPIVVTGPQRFAALKDVPTVIETGFAGAAVESWLGLVAPADTPDPIVGKLNAATRALGENDDFVHKIDLMSFIPKVATPKEFANLITEEHRRWSPVLQAAGLRLD